MTDFPGIIRMVGSRRVLAAVIVAGFIALSPVSALAEQPPVALDEKDDSVKWTPIMKLGIKAPAIAGNTYVGEKLFETEKLALRFKVDLTVLDGNVGNLTLTLHEIGRRGKKHRVMTVKRSGEDSHAMRIKPGKYKLEITANNVNATVTVDEGEPRRK